MPSGAREDAETAAAVAEPGRLASASVQGGDPETVPLRALHGQLDAPSANDTDWHEEALDQHVASFYFVLQP